MTHATASFPILLKRRANNAGTKTTFKRFGLACVEIVAIQIILAGQLLRWRMRHLSNFGDERNAGFCVHCGRVPDTRDHMPSRVFLDEPYPANLPVSPACFECNNGFASDEEYLASLIECVIAGTTEHASLVRPKIMKLLQSNPKLAARIGRSRRVTETGVVFDVEADRAQRVFLKLARGHAAFEYNEPQLGQPNYLHIKPLHLMSADERHDFEHVGSMTGVWPEVGSRAMQRLLVVDACIMDEGWVEVQPERYRYCVTQEYGLTVKIVIRNYITFEASWG